jgi:hypothetical protein
MMNRRWQLLLSAFGFALLLVLGLTFSTEASAQEDDGNVVYQKKTVVNFDEDTIDGDLTKPDTAYVEVRKRLRHSNLIRIREDFRIEVLGSVMAL